jgi:hypothetical protein
MTKRTIYIDPWPINAPTDVHTGLGLFQDIICALEHIAPQLSPLLVNASMASKDTARVETDNLAYELRRIRRGIRYQDSAHLNRGELAHDVESALEWSGVAEKPTGDKVARARLEEVVEILRPYLKIHGIEM